MRQRRVRSPGLDEPGGKGDERSVGGGPVDRAYGVVLGVGVVVAALAEAELHAHREHRHAARGDKQGHEIALVARSRLQDRLIVRRTLDAVIPAQVVVRAVAIALAVGLVVLVRIGDEVAQGKAVMGDDEIDARGRSRGMLEDVARAGHPGRDFAARARVAAPEPARGVAEAVVPFGEFGAEPAKLVSARTHVPGLGDQARLGEDRIGVEGLEERRFWIKAVSAAAERGGEIEAEAVETAVDHPPPQRPDRHADHQRAVERQAIAGAGIVDVSRWIAGIEAKPGGVVEAAERQRRPELVALAVVVEDDVEDRLDARRVQSVRRRAHFRPAARRELRVGRPEHDGVIAPGVREPERWQMTFVDERVRRHDLDRGDAERCEMRDRRRMGEPGERPSLSLGDRRVEAGKATQVELVDDERFRRDALESRLARRRRPGDGLWRKRPAVVAELEHRRVEAERPVEPPGVRIGQELRGVEAGAARRVVRPGDAKAVTRARPEAGREAAQDAVRVAGHRRAKNLAIAVVEAQRRALGVGQDERRSEPFRRNGDAKARRKPAHSEALARAR